MRGFSFRKSVTVEIPVVGVAGAGNQQTRIVIPDQPNLRYTRLIAVEAFNVNDIAATAPNGNPLVTAADMLKASLVLYTYQAPNPLTKPQEQLANGVFGEYVKWVPMNSIHRVQNNVPDPFVRELPIYENVYCQWEKSYVLLSTALGNTTTRSFYLQVYYSDY